MHPASPACALCNTLRYCEAMGCIVAPSAAPSSARPLVNLIDQIFGTRTMRATRLAGVLVEPPVTAEELLATYQLDDDRAGL